jgi:Methyltransferase domain
MTALERGEAVGIDPYTAAAAVQSDAHDRGVDLTAWPAQVDWEGLHSEVLAGIETHAIGERCRVVRARSDEAAADFASGSIDLLHVDGNHDAASVARDVELYLSKVSPGGFIVMDDASWSSVRPTCERLATEHELVFQLFDGGVTVDGVGGNDFAVFRISEPASRGVRR